MVFKIAGTDFKLGFGFIFLFFAYVFLGCGVEAIIAFLSVLAHESAHALMAAGYELEIDSVELTPFGGVARLSGLMEADPFVEISVAVAGPASSFLLAGLATMLWRNGVLMGPSVLVAIDQNLFLGMLNLLPVLPLDGGRAVRALISKNKGYYEATRDMCRLGRLAGALAVAAGLVVLVLGRPAPNLLVYGIFGYSFALKEQRYATYRTTGFLIRRRDTQTKQRLLKTEKLTAFHFQRVDQICRAFSPRRYYVVSVLGPDMQLVAEFTETELIEHILSGRADWTLGDLVSRV